MTEAQFKLHVAKEPVGFMHGFEVDKRDKIYAQPGEVYIEHVSSAHVITIINPDDRWFYSYLYAINTTAIGGWYGVYADEADEAIDIFADYCQEFKPGLVQTAQDIIDEDGEEAYENYSGDYAGPYGNKCLYFTERGHGVHIERVDDPKVPPVKHLFYSRFFPVADVLDINVKDIGQDGTVREYLVYTAFVDCRDHFEGKYRDEPWAVRLSDLIWEAWRKPDDNVLKIHSSVHAVTNPDAGGFNVYIISLLDTEEN